MLNLLKEIQTSAEEVYKHLGTGHSEAVYHKAMEVELRTRNINYSTKCPISINYKGFVVGYNEPDLIVKFINTITSSEIIIVVELKATTYSPRESEKAQLHSYLRTLDTEYGILINFPQPTSKSKIQGIDFLPYGFTENIKTTKNGDNTGNVISGNSNTVNNFTVYSTPTVPKISI